MTSKNKNSGNIRSRGRWLSLLLMVAATALFAGHSSHSPIRAALSARSPIPRERHPGCHHQGHQPGDEPRGLRPESNRRNLRRERVADWQLQGRSSRQAFKAESVTLSLQISEVKELGFSLHVGSGTETVQVTSASPLVDTESSSAGEVIEGARLSTFPSTAATSPRWLC